MYSCRCGAHLQFKTRRCPRERFAIKKSHRPAEEISGQRIAGNHDRQIVSGKKSSFDAPKGDGGGRGGYPSGFIDLKHSALP